MGIEGIGARIARKEDKRFITGRDYRMVAFDYPTRAKDFADYKANVADWHAAIEAIYARLLRDELAERRFRLLISRPE